MAKKFFGEESAQQEKAQQYVEQVFDEYDVDKSGELSYEEARDFLKGIMAYLDANGNLTDGARAEFLAMVKESEETEMIETAVEVDTSDADKVKTILAANFVLLAQSRETEN